ncbi:pyruvate dehydrogenase E2 component (dihydrolipoamide acetyltransferase) [Microbacterium foliorum]|uniref:dihydrolipoamide acetyltransferase family protein n=1 Tax=Microbacterium foliorum TaxID=104336 RepID=UPI00209DA29F|nr:dihydrolipoamide acetyltransferase family protein [Microbacterium foliorum]MCP1429290.1 pyruvate dehydrogenase E2 component (dihydrolipoamide acetyltransferase) [Microbacterium foliorum]
MTALTTRVFRLPDLGEGLTEAGLVQWLVAVGDTVATDQAIAEVETAKSVVELPSPFAGVVTALHGEPGETIDVGAPVLEVADGAADSSGGASAAVEHDAYREEERAGSGNVLIGYGTSERGVSGRRRPRVQAAARQTPTSAGTPAPAPATSTATETSTASETSTATETSSASESVRSGSDARARRPVAVRSPLVRRLARDLGLDVHAIAPTGHDGAVTRADVLAAAVNVAVDGAAASSHDSPVDDGPGFDHRADVIDGLSVASRERMSALRKAVSAKLARSRSEIPEATVWVDVDATDLWTLRSQMAPEGGTAPSVTALIARFVLLALEDHPVLASRLSDDGSEMISFDGVNLGVAADTARGLMVPVIPRAHELSIEQLDGALRELSATARAGSMPPERLRGSTFTLNNYGGLGVDGSAAIINHPDVAILGIGRIIERAWVVEGQIVPRRIAQLSLVFDHRVCDGGYAAGFLRRVTELIEHPLRAFGRV